jgi:hypothetical protein
MNTGMRRRANNGTRSWLYNSAPANNGMHLTADTLLVIISKGSGRRVMPGVMLLRRALLFCTCEARCVIAKGRSED